MPNVTFKEQEQIVKYRYNSINSVKKGQIRTDKHTKRYTHMTGPPATCPLCGLFDSMGDLQPDCLADRPVTGWSSPVNNKSISSGTKEKVVLVVLQEEIMNHLDTDLLLQSRFKKSSEN
jgi:hypothetical protein